MCGSRVSVVLQLYFLELASYSLVFVVLHAFYFLELASYSLVFVVLHAFYFLELASYSLVSGTYLSWRRDFIST